jgi:hypothetical protein
MITASGAAEILKTPSGPVVVPFVLPLMLTLTPVRVCRLHQLLYLLLPVVH